MQIPLFRVQVVRQQKDVIFQFVVSLLVIHSPERGSYQRYNKNILRLYFHFIPEAAIVGGFQRGII